MKALPAVLFVVLSLSSVGSGFPVFQREHRPSDRYTGTPADVKIVFSNSRRLEENWETITYDDFESGFGNFEDGGRDAKRIVDSRYAHQGQASIRIRDNTGYDSSIFHKSDQDVSNYSALRVQFWFYPLSMDNYEYLYLKYSTDGGSSWTTKETYERGEDFQNGSFYLTSVEFDEVPGPNIRIRFECDGSRNDDRIYIDEVRFEGLVSSPATEPPTPDPTPSPTEPPTPDPTPSPTDEPTPVPTQTPTPAPTVATTPAPSERQDIPAPPTIPPTDATSAPTKQPTPSPQPPATPGCSPSNMPTFPPSVTPDTVVSFYAMGDVPYSIDERYCLNHQLRNLDLTSPNGASFLIHLGDLRQGGGAGSTPCSVSTYSDIGELFSHPNNAVSYNPQDVLFVVGDNEWVDCWDKDLAWTRYLDHFGPGNQYGFGELTSGVTVHRQYGVYRQPGDHERKENFAFFQDDVLFLGVNNIGGDAQDDESSRVAQNYDWVNQQFQIYSAPPHNMVAAVIFGHASLDGTRAQYFGTPLRNLLKISYPYLPVMYLHGDAHRYCVTRPDADLDYLVQVSVDSGLDAPPLLVSVIKNPSDGSTTFELDDGGGLYTDGCPLVLETTWNSPTPTPAPTAVQPTPPPGSQTTPFINEFYTAGDDTQDFVEIAFPEGMDISSYSVEFYKGVNLLEYRTTSLSACTMAATVNGMSFCHVDGGPIYGGWNGGNGIALVDPSNTVVQFLSYGGTFTPIEGAANGVTSTDIGLTDPWNSEAGNSFQLGGSGCSYDEFTWQDSLTLGLTKGTVNANQQVTSCGSVAPTPQPTLPPTPQPVTGQPTPETAFINEFHHDNLDEDVGEFVEVAFTQGMDISNYNLEFYKASNGNMYRQDSLSGCTMGATVDGLSFCHVDGGPIYDGYNGGHGIALVDDSSAVLQFLSYGGTFAPDEGSANGMTSTDIGVREPWDAPVGVSLQLGGSGCAYDDFTWQDALAQTKGTVNANQAISCGSGGGINTPSPTSSPTPQPTTGGTSAPTGPVSATYVPGQAGVIENGLLLSTGLTARMIATEREYVTYENGQLSSDKFHRNPDGAAVYDDPATGGWIYVSNAESENYGGVGALTFNSAGNVTGYTFLNSQEQTKRNCGGGKTFWGTWLSCEEVEGGRVWEYDPWNNFVARKTLIGGPTGDVYESAAYDNRDINNPTFYVTTDRSYGPVLRYTPDTQAVADAQSTNPPDYTDLLHKNDTFTAKSEYLLLQPDDPNVPHDGAVGSFVWTDDFSAAETNAKTYYENSEGIDIRDGTIYMTCKDPKLLIILDIDTMRYSSHSTNTGVFDNQPDQIRSILGDNGDDILYFCEDGGELNNGVHGRDANGNFFTILENSGEDSTFSGEVTGLGFSPDRKHMYVSYQRPGIIFDITRTDGLPFGGQRLDIKYHAPGNLFALS